MITIQLHNSPHAATVDDDDYPTVSQFNWYYNPEGYAMSRKTVNGKRTTIWMHRLIMGAQPGQAIDHRDGNGLNNQRDNLRFATAANNMQNRRKNKGTISKYKGVSLVRKTKKWRASIDHNYRKTTIGYFEHEEDAARAYDAKARELFGEFARTNF